MNPDTGGKRAVKVMLNPQQLRNRIAFLKEFSLILYTADIAASRDTVVDWTKVILENRFNIPIVRVRQLNRSCFLLTVNSEEERDKVLTATPLYLGENHMVFALPWESTFNPEDISSTKVPVWVELSFVHATCECFRPEMLQSIGKIIHYSSVVDECKFTGIRACLLLDLSEELPEVLEITDESSEDGFTKVIGKNKICNLTPQAPSKRFEVLADSSSDDEQEHQKGPGRLAAQSTATGGSEHHLLSALAGQPIPPAEAHGEENITQDMELAKEKHTRDAAGITSSGQAEISASAPGGGDSKANQREKQNSKNQAKPKPHTGPGNVHSK
ncbi:hypothetical protein R1sor_021056 [Riccia sorocarpa]|uniref:DUF4283 domain-containing protein n=1 Tax=Riccia sorocarpa TaxID=122646 RepID=A0ABD3GJC0_9MARC